MLLIRSNFCSKLWCMPSCLLWAFISSGLTGWSQTIVYYVGNDCWSPLLLPLFLHPTLVIFRVVSLKLMGMDNIDTLVWKGGIWAELRWIQTHTYSSEVVEKRNTHLHWSFNWQLHVDQDQIDKILKEKLGSLTANSYESANTVSFPHKQVLFVYWDEVWCSFKSVR